MANKAEILSGDIIDINAPRTAVITFEGHQYAVPKDRGEWAIEVIEALEAQPVPRQIEALHQLLGDEQWAAWRTRHRKMADVEGMYEAIGKVTGGNS